MPDSSQRARLHELMSSSRRLLADGIVEHLRNSSAEHYRRLAEGVLESRALELVDAFLASLVETPSVFIRHIMRVTEERIAEGFYLVEIQTALRILEELAWNRVVADAPPADQVRHLGQVTGVIGAAKDQMAQIFLEHLEAAENRILRLQRRVEVMARGTDPGTVMIDGED